VPVAQLGRRERKKKAVRDSICNETIKLIERHGVDGVTIDAICDCVDIAKKTFYNYYASKHELLLDLCQMVLLQGTEAMMLEVMHSGKSAGDQLAEIIAVIAKRDQDAGGLERELIGYSVNAMSVNLQQGAGQLAYINRMFLAFFQHNSDALKAEMTPAFCAEMTVGMLNAVTLNWLHNKEYDSTSRYAMLLSYLQNSMLKTSPALDQK